MKSPIKGLLKLGETENLKSGLRFLGLSAAIYYMLGFSRVFVIKEHDLITSFIYSTYFLLTLLISIPVFHKLSNWRSKKGIKFRGFTILSCYYIGFSLMVSGVYTYLQTLHIITGAIVTILGSIFMIIVIYKTLKRFLGIGYGWIFLFNILSSIGGGILGVGWLYLASLLFRIELAPLGT